MEDKKVSRETSKIDLYKIWLNYGKLKIEKSGNQLSRLINATLEDIEKTNKGLIVLKETKEKVEGEKRSINVSYWLLNGSVKHIETKYVLKEKKIILSADKDNERLIDENIKLRLELSTIKDEFNEGDDDDNV